MHYQYLYLLKVQFISPDLWATCPYHYEVLTKEPAWASSRGFLSLGACVLMHFISAEYNC